MTDTDAIVVAGYSVDIYQACRQDDWHLAWELSERLTEYLHSKSVLATAAALRGDR